MVKSLWTFAAVTIALICGPALPVYANGQCPAIGQSPSCSVLITINTSGSLSFQVDPSVGPYDGVEDVLVGVVNKSGATVFGISLTGTDIFGFDGDGAGTLFGSAGATGYEGPGTSFSIIDSDHGNVNFTNGLNKDGFIWFSLEGSPSQVRLSQRVTVDPGHGSNCAAVNQPVGAIGDTDYPASNPPSGKLHEDILTVQVANTLNVLLVGKGFDVQLTKTDPVTCPTYLERTTRANNARSNIFISVHYNAARFNLFGLGSGSLGVYNSSKSASHTLADKVAADVSAAIGVNNRGSRADDTLAVLKATTSRMAAVLIEVARLSAPDEDIVHNPFSEQLAAAGILLGIQDFLNQ